MTRHINLALQNTLVEQIDIVAATRYVTWTAYIRHAIVEQLKVDTKNESVRRTMAKQLPQRFITGHKTEEFGITDDYL